MSDLEHTTVTLPEVESNIVKVKAPVEATIVESYIATHGSSPNFIRHITFDVSGTPLEGKFVSGQSIGVLAPGLDESGKPHKLRLYSVSSPSGGEGENPALVSTTVKRVIDEHWETQELFTGVCSNYLSSLKPGDKVMVTGPSGKSFLLPERPQDYHYVFFATGTGIAPFRAMILELLQRGITSHIALVFGCPYRTWLLYYEDFKKLDQEHDHIHYITAISREASRPDGTKPYVQTAIIDQAEVLQPILSKPNTLIYICGLKGMESGIYSLLMEQGLSGYCELSSDLVGKDPSTWTREERKSAYKASERTFVEVY